MKWEGEMGMDEEDWVRGEVGEIMLLEFFNLIVGLLFLVVVFKMGKLANWWLAWIVLRWVLGFEEFDWS